MCECKSVYFGKLCTEKYRCKNCNFNTCITNNTCHGCKPGWDGKNCKNRNINKYKMCLNNEIKIYSKKISCDCEPNYLGKYCEINCSNICQSNNCSLKALEIINKL
ncbi:hypothetical protein HZS_1121 [Henneguya salminicola]|nr:hypothetical protein HZS_1121 [Henneguya salminicola]